MVKCDEIHTEQPITHAKTLIQTQVTEDVATTAECEGPLPVISRLAATEVTVDPVHPCSSSLLVVKENQIWEK
ncbi:hypothetical protein E2C01_017916 [Portunus trituberculatus]|uniref:Uncharacterized protein n=1 Tax=Portunus trituberculatus TaxID=210409 RepID=A0A5B7DV46_PORTR|nr:hypothetical protein [Portunus trituberculatus]